MWPLFLFKLLSLIFICNGSRFSKKHIINNRISSNESELGYSTYLGSRHGNSVGNDRPIIIGLKKALGNVEELTKFLSNRAVTKDILTPMEHHASSKIDKSKNFLHISQTEYPQIFHTQQSKGSNIFSNDNEVFYPFKNIYVESLEQPLLNPESVALKFYDSSFNEKNNDDDDSLESLLSPKKKSEHLNESNKNFYLDNYILPPKGKKIKVIPGRNHKFPKISYATFVDKSDKPISSDRIILDFINENYLKNMQNDLLKKVNLLECKTCASVSKSLSKNVSQEYDPMKIEEENLSTSITDTISTSTISLSKYENSKNEYTKIFPSSTYRTLPTSITSEKHLYTLPQKKFEPYIRGTLDPKNSLNLQILLTLKVNNETFSLVPNVKQ